MSYGMKTKLCHNMVNNMVEEDLGYPDGTHLFVESGLVKRAGNRPVFQEIL